VAYLRCPACRLTAPATAYFLRGDECPRCLTPMEPADRFREPKAPVVEDKSSVSASPSAA
jgi:hypothetical protein